MPKTPISATTTVARITSNVTSAAGGAGAVISDSTDSISVKLMNTGEFPVEYNVDGGAWTSLPHRSDANLSVNLANSVVRTRKAASAGDGHVTLEITQIDNVFSAGDTTVSLYSLPINARTASYTLVLTDAGKQIDMSVAGANTVTIPTNANEPFEIGTVIWVCMQGAGITTINGPGVTLQKPAAKSLSISAQYEMARLHKVATDTWRVNAT
jgi:hypothetical protein